MLHSRDEPLHHPIVNPDPTHQHVANLSLGFLPRLGKAKRERVWRLTNPKHPGQRLPSEPGSAPTTSPLRSQMSVPGAAIVVVSSAAAR